jgi:hypothetical protein
VLRRLIFKVGVRERYVELAPGKECIMGRQLDSGFFVNHTSVSRRHCCLRATATGVEIEDLVGRNTSFLNGQRIVTRTLLTDGAVLQIGVIAFTIHLLDKEPPVRCSSCGRYTSSEELAGSPAGEALCRACSNRYPCLKEADFVPLIEAQGYSVKESLGGIPATFHVERTTLGRSYIIKAIELAGIDRDRIAGLREEARALAMLDHPAITTITDAIETQGVLLLVLPMPTGVPLEQHVQEQGLLSPSAALEMGRALAEALTYIHSKGVVHRELTPDNVFISSTPRLQVRVTNFPLARDIAALSRSFSSGWALYRVVWVAPEVIADPAGRDPRSDVFGIGAVILGALTGVSPYGEVTPAEHVKRLMAGDPLPLALDGVPAGLRGVLAQLLATNPEARAQTAKAALALLGAAASSL